MNNINSNINSNINDAIIKIDKALDILYNIKRKKEEAITEKIIKQSRDNTNKKLENVFINIENKLLM